MIWYDFLALFVFVCILILMSGCTSKRELVTDSHSQVHTILQALDTFRLSDVTIKTVYFPVIRDSVRVRDSVVIKTIRNLGGTQLHTQKDTTVSKVLVKQAKQKATSSKSNGGWLLSLKTMFHYLVLMLIVFLGGMAFCYFFMRHK